MLKPSMAFTLAAVVLWGCSDQRGGSPADKTMTSVDEGRNPARAEPESVTRFKRDFSDPKRFVTVSPKGENYVYVLDTKTGCVSYSFNERSPILTGSGYPDCSYKK
jgi:hypothetical protein